LFFEPLDAAIEACEGPEALMNTHNCDQSCRNLKCCDCVDCALQQAATASAEATKIDIPVTPRCILQPPN
jgi:hypothetical protein